MSIRDQIRHAIAEVAGWEPHELLEWHTFEELGTDSTDILDMRYRVENIIDRKLPDDKFAQCNAVGDIVRLALA